MWPFTKRKMKISLYVTDLPVGGMPMYSPLCVPVTTFLLTTLSPSAIRSSNGNVKVGIGAMEPREYLLQRLRPVTSSGNGVRITASASTSSSIVLEMISTSFGFMPSVKRLAIGFVVAFRLGRWHRTSLFRR